MIQALGTAIEAQIPISKEEYIQITYKPSSRQSVNDERLKEIIDTLGPYGVPDTVIASMHDCFVTNPNNTRSFRLSKKKVPYAKKGI